MASETLTRERILEATEEVLRRYGPAKATVVDVARALGVSHGSVYRHFASKAALRGAVTERWLDRTSQALAEVAAAEAPAADRLRRWLADLFAAKRHKAFDDPELFATYMALIGESRESGVVERHVDDLTGQLAGIVEDGVRQGEFAVSGTPAATARAVFDATARFHDPAFAPDWRLPGIEAAFDALVDLVLRGLRS